MYEDVIQLANLMKKRNILDEQVAKLIGRPAEKGHIGEYIASQIFDIKLYDSAVTEGHDGIFTNGSFAGRSVNVKLYGKCENLLDMPKDAAQKSPKLPDYYLVITGPKGGAISSRGMHRPSVIEYVFLFDTYKLIDGLIERKQRQGKTMIFGVAASVPTEFWTDAEIYPTQTNKTLILTEDQRRLLALFRA